MYIRTYRSPDPTSLVIQIVAYSLIIVTESFNISQSLYFYFVTLPKYFELLYSFLSIVFVLKKNDVRAAWLNLLSLAKKNEGK